MLEWFMSYKKSKSNFESVQCAIKLPRQYFLINTLPLTEQQCLISGTLDANLEEQTINDMLYSIHTNDRKIIIYGKNSHDDTTITKYNQLRKLGLTDVSIYTGGMFEWLLLQDVYGDNEFPTTSRDLDILRYKSIDS
jgi:hypothetical protein